MIYALSLQLKASVTLLSKHWRGV